MIYTMLLVEVIEGRDVDANALVLPQHDAPFPESVAAPVKENLFLE
jgi:hypothetical protein